MNKKLTRKFDVTRTGVTTDQFTSSGAIIMVVTVLLYAIVQVNSLQKLSLMAYLDCVHMPSIRELGASRHWKGVFHYLNPIFSCFFFPADREFSLQCKQPKHHLVGHIRSS